MQNVAVEIMATISEGNFDLYIDRCPLDLC